MKKKGKKKKNPVKTKPVRNKKKIKKKVNWSKGVAEWVSHVCLITKMSLNYKLWKQKIGN